ncbi:repressed By RIM101 protein 2 [[Candida] railenensis]|uniref:Repressed By RIM101 protein 2 n=1 Tax=[Candida] railenensis TaxID=45579 RepID=A0A9P0VVJ2_9ASCO|nr:repressed By RIM101 protein 2 [[Candida] railenensis]
MKLSYTLLVATLAASVKAANSEDVAFLTALVSDYKGHGSDYLNFFGTASDVPGALSSLAQQVRTYKDDSYTTLLDNSDINIGELESYATNLPWYTRVASAAGITGDLAAGETGSGSGSASATGSGSGSGSGSAAASVTSAVSSATADSSSSASASSSAGSTSSGGAVSAAYAPLGVVLGAAAVALM